MKLTQEQSQKLLRERGIWITEACDRCGKLLGSVRWTRKGEPGEWCSAACRDGIKKPVSQSRTCLERVAVWSTGLLVVLSCLFFWLVDTGAPMMLWLAMSSWTFACGAFYGITGIFLADLFDTRVRYSGVSFSYQMAAMLVGAPAPIIAAALVHRAGGASWPVAIFLVANAFISFIAVCFSAGRYRTVVTDPEPA